MSSRKPAIRREARLPTPDGPAVRVQTRGGLANHEAREPLNVLRVRHREGKGSASEGKANIGVFKTETLLHEGLRLLRERHRRELQPIRHSIINNPRLAAQSLS